MKKRITITIDEDLHKWLKENVSNISKYLETLAKHSKYQIEPSIVVIHPIEAIEKPEIVKIEKPKIEEVKEDVKEVEKEVRDLRELYEKYRENYIKYLTEKRKIGEVTIRDYVSSLDRDLIKGIKEPKDLDKIKKTKTFSKAVRNLLNFLEDQFYQTELFGYHFDLWRKYLKIEPLEEKEKGHATTEQVVKAYKLIKDKFGDDEVTINLFKLIFYSGLRHDHAFRLLTTFDPNKLEIKDKIALYPTYSLGKKPKLTFYAFLPIEFARKLRRLEPTLDEKTYNDRLNIKRWKPESGNPVTVNTLRSWFQTFAIENDLNPDAVDYIVGHKPKTVRAKHYLDLPKIAVREYEKIVDKLTALIPP